VLGFIRVFVLCPISRDTKQIAFHGLIFELISVDVLNLITQQTFFVRFNRVWGQRIPFRRNFKKNL